MIKQKLIEKRKERNLTQEEFAFKLGLDPSNYKNFKKRVGQNG